MIDRTKPYRLAASAVIGGLLASSTAAQTVGVNASVVNDVRMTTEANPTVHHAAIKERVSLGNDIQTGKSSILQVLLLDRTSFTVGSNARIKVDRFVYDPNRSASAVGMTVTKGAFRFMSGKALHANPGQSAITTPVGTIGIRGTIVEGVIGPDALRIMRGEPGFQNNSKIDLANATLILLRGPGPKAESETPGGIDIVLGDKSIPIDSPGYALFIPGPGQTPIGPFLLSQAGSLKFAELLRYRHEIDNPGLSPLVRNPLTDLFFQNNAQRQD